MKGVNSRVPRKRRREKERGKSRLVVVVIVVLFFVFLFISKWDCMDYFCDVLKKKERKSTRNSGAYNIKIVF